MVEKDLEWEGLIRLLLWACFKGIVLKIISF